MRGSACTLIGLQGVNLMHGDQIRAQLTCGSGNTVPGMPGGGLAVAGPEGTYEFGANLQAMVGIYRLCWRSAQVDELGEAAGEEFLVEAGIIIVNGLHESSVHCIIGTECIFDGVGSGLTAGDKMVLKKDLCEENHTVAGFRGFALTTTLSSSVSKFTFGLVQDASPGTYVKCWCSGTGACQTASDFAAFAGLVHVACSPGTSQGRAGSSLGNMFRSSGSGRFQGLASGKRPVTNLGSGRSPLGVFPGEGRKNGREREDGCPCRGWPSSLEGMWRAWVRWALGLQIRPSSLAGS